VVCNSGYNLNTIANQCELIHSLNENDRVIKPEIKMAQTFGQATVGSGVAAGSASAILSSSSSQGAWSSVNQFQLYLLIPLVGAYIHKDVLAFLEGFNFSMISFSFLSLDSIPIIKNILSLFPGAPNSPYMQSIGLEYESTIRNIMGTMLLILILLLLHILIAIPLQIYARKYDEDSKFRRFSKFLFLFFTFAIYIRVILESYLIVCLSCVLEFWRLGPNEAVAVLVFIVLFTVFFFVVWSYVNRVQAEMSDSYFKEFFSGIKQSKSARLYFSTFILRRLLSVIIIVPGESVPVMVRVILFASIHCLVFVFTVAVRPFQRVKDNLIEALNDLSYGVLTIVIVYFNTKEAWSDLVANSVIYWMLGMSLLTSSIQFGFMIQGLVKYFKQKCLQKNKKVQSEQLDNTHISKSDLPSQVFFLLPKLILFK
jgi:hypothetical protein